LEPVNIHDLIGLIKEIPWIFWLLVAGGLGSWVQHSWERRRGVRRERAAESWPVAEGLVQSIGLKPHDLRGGHPSSYDVAFEYSYSVHEGGETGYYSGNFSRTLPEEAAAWEWLRTLKDKRIRVHVQPGRPKVSAVLAADLDAQFPLLQPFNREGSLPAASAAAKLPAELRGPTEIAAWMTALGFCLALVDHLYRLLAGRGLHPRLVIVLWIGFLAVGVPFGLWYQSKGGESFFGKPKEWAKVPQWLRISTYALNLYVGSFWLINLVLSSGVFHAHWDVHRLEPMWNGALLATLYGDAAAILYSKMESFEDPYDLSAQGLRPR
jgi:hypothetical protein